MRMMAMERVLDWWNAEELCQKVDDDVMHRAPPCAPEAKERVVWHF